MSEKRLPKTLEPRKFAGQSGQLSGELLLDGMPRLVALIVRAPQLARVSLTGRIDEEGFAVIRGSVHVTVSLQCQRCLQAYDEELGAEFSLVPVVDEQAAKSLPDRYEPLLVEHHEVDMVTMIEDELLLALPTVARHAAADCTVQIPQVEQTVEPAKQKNPFAVLAGLKRKK